MVPDKLYVRTLYRLRMHKHLNLKDPQTYNEKLQWLKLYDRNPLYTKMVDKVDAKEYVSGIIGEEHIIPTLGVWNSFDEIDFDSLPNQFVLKTSHDSGGVVICRDKSVFDKEHARQRIEKSMRNDYYVLTREWPYKNVPKRILAEQYMVDESGYELKDYKWFCFDGEVKALYIATDRGSDEETKFDFFDSEFNHLPFTNGHPNSHKPILKPQGFEEMKRLASKLSKGIPQVRVDLYDINGKVYFGELTFFHWGGVKRFVPDAWDKTFGGWIKLPKKT